MRMRTNEELGCKGFNSETGVGTDTKFWRTEKEQNNVGRMHIC
jgi:hypothetical protein